jgi:hypothetical protein
MTLPSSSINFPYPDGSEQIEALRVVLESALEQIGALPPTGLILKVRQGERGEEIVNWTLADSQDIETIAAGLSVAEQLNTNPKRSVSP